MLYCPVCDVQFSSLHNKQQHCLSRKHNKEVVTFVQNSVNIHQEKNGNLSTCGNCPTDINSENCAKSPADHNSSRNHLDTIVGTEDSIKDHDAHLVIPTVNHTVGTEGSVKDHDAHLAIPTVNHTVGTEDSVKDHDAHLMIPTVNHTVGTEDSVKDCVNNNVDHTNNTENHMSITRDHTNNTDDHMTCAENHVSSAEDHMDSTEDPNAGKSCHTSGSEDCTSLTIINCTENSSSCTLADTNTSTDCTDAVNSTNSISNVEDHVITTDSHACSSTDYTNNDENEGSHDQPFVHFPPHYSLNHMIHDFTLHQQG